MHAFLHSLLTVIIKQTVITLAGIFRVTAISLKHGFFFFNGNKFVFPSALHLSEQMFTCTRTARKQFPAVFIFIV